MYSCADSSTLPDIISFFKAPPSQAPEIAQFLLGNLYQLDMQPDLAVQTNNAIVSKCPGTSLEVKAEISNMLIDLYDKKDIPSAQALLSNIESQSSLTTPIELQDAKEALSLYSGRTSGSSAASSKKVTSVSSSTLPKTFAIMQNYPNPFNPTTTITYQLPADGHVTLKVYDVLGREVKTLVDQDETAGYHQATLDGTDLASGIYFYRINITSGGGVSAEGLPQAEKNFVSVKKALLLK